MGYSDEKQATELRTKYELTIIKLCLEYYGEDGVTAMLHHLYADVARKRQQGLLGVEIQRVVTEEWRRGLEDNWHQFAMEGNLFDPETKQASGIHSEWIMSLIEIMLPHAIWPAPEPTVIPFPNTDTP